MFQFGNKKCWTFKELLIKHCLTSFLNLIIEKTSLNDGKDFFLRTWTQTWSYSTLRSTNNSKSFFLSTYSCNIAASSLTLFWNSSNGLIYCIVIVYDRHDTLFGSHDFCLDFIDLGSILDLRLCLLHNFPNFHHFGEEGTSAIDIKLHRISEPRHNLQIFFISNVKLRIIMARL